MYNQKPFIGVKGRIQTRIITKDDGTKKKKTEIVAEKVTFLAQASSNKEKTENQRKEINKKENAKKETSKKAD